jgi:hypothetical protein
MAIKKSNTFIQKPKNYKGTIMSRDYIPTGETQFQAWYENFVAKLPTYASQFRFTGEELAEIQASFEEVRRKLSEHTSMKSALQSLTQVKNMTFHDARVLARRMAKDAKNHRSYTPAIGEDLGIVIPESPLMPGGLDNVQPTFFAVILADRIRLDWIKDIFDGVIVQTRRNAETTWTAFGFDDMSPYEDMRPNAAIGVPEMRYYRMRYRYNGEEVGRWSNEVKVVCGLDAAT